MKYTRIALWIVLVGISACFAPDHALAQQDGFLGSSDVAPPASDSMLPPGAVRQGAYVQHPIQSQQENLHLLASFYYGNTREWRKIYDDNRSVIKNPNRLPVGEVLQIDVGENWQPLVAYDKWFALAVRNGEWQPGVPWRRANEALIPEGPLPTPLPEGPAASTVSPVASAVSPAISAASATPTPVMAQTPAPEPTAAIPEEAPPSEHPVEEQAPESVEPTASPEQAESATAEQTPTDEQAPAEPAF